MSTTALSTTTDAPPRRASTTMRRRGVRRFGRRDVTGYLFGDLACNFSFDLITMYMFLYFTQWVGIELVHYALIILIAKILDAVNDPLIGALIDSRPSAATGKFKRWITYFAVPLSFSATILFINSAEWDYWAKIALVFVGYVLWDLLYSFVNVPYGSMASVMTTDPAERTLLSTARSIGGFIPNIIYGIGLPLIIYTSMEVDGEIKSIFQGQYMVWIAFGTGFLAVACFAVLLRNTEERLIHAPAVDPEPAPAALGADASGASASASQADRAEHSGTPHAGTSHAGTPRPAAPRYRPFRAFFVAFRNRAMIGLVLAAIGQILLIQGAQQLHALTFQMYFNDGRLNSLTIVIVVLPMLIGATVGPRLVRRFGKAELSSYPLFGAAAVYLAMFLLPISNPFVWWAGLALAGTLSFGLAIYTWAMIADVIDYQELRTGGRTEGTTYSAFSLVRKIGQGLGQALVPAMIAVAIPGLQLDEPETWTDSNVVAVKEVSVLFPMLGVLVVAAALIWVYPLGRKNLARVQTSLGHDEPAAEPADLAR